MVLPTFSCNNIAGGTVRRDVVQRGADLGEREIPLLKLISSGPELNISNEICGRLQNSGDCRAGWQASITRNESKSGMWRLWRHVEILE